MAVVKDLWERVRTLWDRVELTSEDRDVFESQNAGISQRVIQSVSITLIHFCLNLQCSTDVELQDTSAKDVM